MNQIASIVVNRRFWQDNLSILMQRCLHILLFFPCALHVFCVCRRTGCCSQACELLDVRLCMADHPSSIRVRCYAQVYNVLWQHSNGCFYWFFLFVLLSSNEFFQRQRRGRHAQLWSLPVQKKCLFPNEPSKRLVSGGLVGYHEACSWKYRPSRGPKPSGPELERHRRERHSLDLSNRFAWIGPREFLENR